MQLLDVKLNSLNISYILLVCITIIFLEEVVEIHERVVENGLTSNVTIVNALIDMDA